MTAILIWRSETEVAALSDQLLTKVEYGHHKAFRMTGSWHGVEKDVLITGSGRSQTLSVLANLFALSMNDLTKVESSTWFQKHSDCSYDATLAAIVMTGSADLELISLTVERGCITHLRTPFLQDRVYAMGYLSPMYDGAPHDFCWTAGSEFIASRLEAETSLVKISRCWTLLQCKSIKAVKPLWEMRNVAFSRSYLPPSAKGAWHDGIMEIPSVPAAVRWIADKPSSLEWD
jgi:hypothetical protein